MSMPQLYDNEKLELYASIKYAIKRDLLLYYVCVISAIVDSIGVNGVYPNQTQILVFGIALPLTAVLFYGGGRLIGYQPRERFIPTPTSRAKLREYDRRHDKGVERIGSIINRIRREDGKQKRADKWRREARAKGMA